MLLVSSSQELLKSDPHARIERAMVLREELFYLANSFSGEETGEVAGQLHGACNDILRAKKWLEYFEKYGDNTCQS